MSVTHELKIHKTHYARVLNGTKTFEIRKNDGFFQKGDTVKLRAVNDDGDYIYLPDSCHDLYYKIGDVYSIPNTDLVVFSLLSMEK